MLKILVIAALTTGTGCQDGFNGNGGGSCCSGFNQCREGEGDCDRDSDCFGDLKCGQGNGLDNNCDSSFGFPSSHDCCYDPNKGGKALQGLKLVVIRYLITLIFNNLPFIQS